MTDFGAAVAEMNKLKEKNKALSDSNASHERQVQVNKETILKQEALIEASEKILKGLESDIDTLVEKVEKLKAQSEELSGDISSKKEELSNITDQVSADLLAEEEAIRDSISSLNEERDEIIAEIHDLNSKKSKLVSYFDKLSKEI